MFIINHLHLSFPLYYSTTDGHRSTSSRRSVSVQMTTPNMEELELQDLQLLLPDFCITLHKTLINLVDKSNNRWVSIPSAQTANWLESMAPVTKSLHFWSWSTKALGRLTFPVNVLHWFASKHFPYFYFTFWNSETCINVLVIDCLNILFSL